MNISMKRLRFLGSSLDALRDFPDEARRAAGFELRAVQNGLEPSDWKSMPIVGAGVNEIRIHVLGEWGVNRCRLKPIRRRRKGQPATLMAGKRDKAEEFFFVFTLCIFVPLSLSPFLPLCAYVPLYLCACIERTEITLKSSPKGEGFSPNFRGGQ